MSLGVLELYNGLRDGCSVTKLILLMFLADYLCFKRYGSKLTGFVWRKMFFGPHPEGIEELGEFILRENMFINPDLRRLGSEICRNIPSYVKRVYGSKSVSELMEYINGLDIVLKTKIGDPIL